MPWTRVRICLCDAAGANAANSSMMKLCFCCNLTVNGTASSYSLSCISICSLSSISITTETVRLVIAVPLYIGSKLVRRRELPAAGLVDPAATQRARAILR